jgi:Fic family protein
MSGLTVPNPNYVGRFRGEMGLEKVRVRVGSVEGVAPSDVDQALELFERKLQEVLAELDQRYGKNAQLDADGFEAVVEVAAWAHAEWVRIHPFANGNGRTARLWANYVLMRYGLPPVLRLRPRPDGGYGAAGAAAMSGDWSAMVSVLRRLLVGTA